jgi:hypothetical protein
MEVVLEKNKSCLKEALHEVKNYESKLQSLSVWWDKIALLGKINSYNIAETIIDDMEETKHKFGELQQRLIHNLLLEHLKKRAQDDSSRAQVAIDILIRNLFERTADVGFLSTDADIRTFLKDPEPCNEAQHLLRERLLEYVKKYSVYDEIIILSPQGEVRCHLDKNNPITRSTDPLIEQTINTLDEYVEVFRYSDLVPGKDQSLIYSCKITADDSANSEVVGVICLCFRFNNEMEGIFSDLLQNNDPSIIALVDAKGVVTASSNKSYLSIGKHINYPQPPCVVRFMGEDCLYTLCETNGYQGFFGLGWRGMVMTPLKNFSGNTPLSKISIPPELIDKSRLFPTELKQISKNSIEVNNDLSLVVLNGKITSARKKAREFMPVLEAIQEIGTNISNVFSSSISSLQDTVVSSQLNDAKFLASLCVNIMDRNLYERANDSRWWALTSAFREFLAKPQISQQERQQITNILNHINDLYTVYSNLYLYDGQGVVVAVSNQDETHIIGQQLDEKTGYHDALKLENSQCYSVSSFVVTPFYNNRPTYIYNAAVRDLADSSKVVGGIGIVFDSEPQFSTMLDESLPSDEKGNVIEGAFAVYCQRDGTIISVSSNGNIEVGSKLDLPKQYLDIDDGKSLSVIYEFTQQFYTLGVSAAKGYREYKTTNDYSNDVIALVFLPMQ